MPFYKTLAINTIIAYNIYTVGKTYSVWYVMARREFYLLKLAFLDAVVVGLDPALSSPSWVHILVWRIKRSFSIIFAHKYSFKVSQLTVNGMS